MTTMFSPDQAREALAGANDKRRALAALRKQLRAGDVTLADVMADPPACMVHLPLFRVILDCKGQGIDSLKRLNAAAVRANVNLAVTLGEASERTRAFVAGHARGASGVRFDDPVTLYVPLRPTRRPVPPHMRKIPNVALRERFLRSGLSAGEVAALAGVRDGKDLKRQLGVVGSRRGLTIPVASRIARALDADPHEVGL